MVWRSKAIAAIAAAVYGPMPGSARSLSSVSGKMPPCSRVTATAQAYRLRARE
ncbi:hypothetical protein ABIG07_004797 [Bradyrhizobium ottawaense]|uniref:Uncharacterized protein n=1 Tax=Bradyrhizobium ottawaense TaxID=931866 RepID=A0ABV4FW55_9BRAD